MRPHHPSPWRNAAGLTLLDTIVALALFLLATSTIGQFLVQQLRTGSSNAAYTRAYTLAAQELEDLRGLPYDSIDSRSSQSREGTLTYAVATTVLANSPEPNMKAIAVDISWNEPGGAQHVQVQSIYTAVQR